MQAVITVGLLAAPIAATAQGCMPLKFTSPSLGGASTTFLEAHQLQIGLAFRRVSTDKYFVGTSEDEASAPAGQPLDLSLNTIDFNLTYATSSRFSLSLTAPLSSSTDSHIHPDGVRHDMTASGLGDISLVGNLWVANPAGQARHNILIGLGVKAPTGSYQSTDAVYTPGGVVQGAVAQTVQPGDGGWAIIGQLQAFQALHGKLSVYATGEYSASLRQHTDVLWPPAGLLWAVPDVYSARAGLALGLSAEHGTSISLGWRVDGTTVNDIVGGHDDYFRHAGYTMYVEPGFSFGTGRDQFTVSVPVRIRENYMTTVSAGHVLVGAGGTADYVIYAGYSRRF
jgi:hypothetical protein